MNCFERYRARAIGAAIVLSLFFVSPALAGHDSAPGPSRSVPCRRCGHAVEKIWVPGRWDVRRKRVICEPAHYETTYVAPTYETRYESCGRPYQVLTGTGGYRKIWVPRRCEWRKRKLWVPGYWKPVRAHKCRPLKPRPYR